MGCSMLKTPSKFRDPLPLLLYLFNCYQHSSMATARLSNLSSCHHPLLELVNVLSDLRIVQRQLSMVVQYIFSSPIYTTTCQ